MKAADLFLERDRVAVSLLQRQFDVDFEECCVILDQLQEMGLIGPYLGGSRRDILLTRDEWLSRVGGAS
jgi:DNA segregation ATPase FtsK/SpoIIIE-like protein